MIRTVGICAALAVAACSSREQPAGGSGGATSAGGSSGSVGATSAGGSSGSAGAGGGVATTDAPASALTFTASDAVIMNPERGFYATTMVLRRGLDGKLPMDPVLVRPTHVVGRRSSDILAVDEPLVDAAVAWIHEHSDQQILVSDVVRAVRTIASDWKDASARCWVAA